MNLEKWLGPLPEKNLSILDDAKARALAEFVEVADVLHPTAGEKRGALAYCYEEHPTHWLLLTLHWGHSAAHDNGWAAQFFPKSSGVTAADVLENFRSRDRSEEQ